MFSIDDSALLTGIIAKLQPRTVIELGSGHSTKVIRSALPADSEHLVFDPYSQRNGQRGTGGVAVIPTSATRVPLDTFQRLEAGDILFVDTSYTVKAGSDVNRIILDVLPALKPGVWIHFHDIFLPFEYHQRWLTVDRLYWAEQYLLQAFLAFNSAFRVELALYSLTRAQRVRTFDGDGSSFWISRVG